MLPSGEYTTLYLLAAASEDTQGDFAVDQQVTPLKVQGWTGFIGQFYNREFAKNGYTVTGIEAPFSKQDNIAWFASHVHQAYPSKNVAYQYCYMYKYEIRLPKGAKSIKLPNNDHIKILAMTVAKGTGEEVIPLQPLYDDFHSQPNTFTFNPTIHPMVNH
jgi:alpha-mannosidase